MAGDARRRAALAEQRPSLVELEVAPASGLFPHHVGVTHVAAREQGEQCAVGEHGVGDEQLVARSRERIGDHVHRLLGLMAARGERGGIEVRLALQGCVSLPHCARDRRSSGVCTGLGLLLPRVRRTGERTARRRCASLHGDRERQ